MIISNLLLEDESNFSGTGVHLTPLVSCQSLLPVFTPGSGRTPGFYSLLINSLTVRMHSTFKRDIVGSNTDRVDTLFRPLVRLAHNRHALG